ncbi:hypothetical protein ACMD2_14343 [Ananas comosus]|uniref:Uncharacterized protein n=1 Tax=Ananas comosus TaxID=4615 RepID=A0A199UIM4_ANACO|nr:hypothetical protein ACMD2_14343 [Ananas comosus]
MASTALAIASGVRCFGGTVASWPVYNLYTRCLDVGKLFDYLRREHAKVPSVWLVQVWIRGGEVGSAGALDEAAEPGDAHHLNKGDLHGRWRRDEDGVHRVIGHALPHHRLIHDHVDAERLEVLPGAYAAQHQ